jgi:hypothetical protein
VTFAPVALVLPCRSQDIGPRRWIALPVRAIVGALESRLPSSGVPA